MEGVDKPTILKAPFSAGPMDLKTTPLKRDMWKGKPAHVLSLSSNDLAGAMQVSFQVL